MREVARSVAFYRDVLGFGVASHDHRIAAVELAGCRVYLFEESPPTPDKPGVYLAPHEGAERGSVVLVLRVADCDQEYAAVRDRGGAFLTAPATPPWGGRRCFLHDPDGYLIELEQPPG